MRDLLGARESDWAAERAKIESVGWGARLLALQDEDGQWAGGSFVPRGFTPQDWKRFGQPWTATTFSLSQLREFGFDPSSDRAKQIVKLVGLNARWDEGGQPYWEGEVEECINGRTVADGAYFGVDVLSMLFGCLASVSMTAVGTARGPMGRSARHFTPRSMCWKGCWSTRKRSAARLNPEKLANLGVVPFGTQPLPASNHGKACRRPVSVSPSP